MANVLTSKASHKIVFLQLLDAKLAQMREHIITELEPHFEKIVHEEFSVEISTFKATFDENEVEEIFQKTFGKCVSWNQNTLKVSDPRV